MKQKLLLLLLAAFAAISANARDFEYTYEGQTLTYTVIDEDAKTVCVSGHSEELNGSLILPANPESEGSTYTLTEIGEKAIYECNSLTAVTIPNSVTEIGWSAFEKCSGLTSVTIPNSVTTIGGLAFSDCSSLTSVTIPNSVTEIGSYAFYRCSGLTAMVIPRSVTKLGWGAFSDCSSLTSVTIPNSVTQIGDFAFSGCSGLTTVTIPNSITRIGDLAFYGSGLTSLTIPNSVTEIGRAAFYGCSDMSAVTLPNAITTIGDKAFSNSSNIKTVTYPSSEPCTADTEMFSLEVYNNAELIVPQAALTKYRKTKPWMDFKNIKDSSFSGLDIAEIDCTDAPAEVYTLGGVKIGNTTEGLLPGVYIVRKGSTAEKIIVTQ